MVNQFITKTKLRGRSFELLLEKRLTFSTCATGRPARPSSQRSQRTNWNTSTMRLATVRNALNLDMRNAGRNGLRFRERRCLAFSLVKSLQAFRQTWLELRKATSLFSSMKFRFELRKNF